VSNSPHHHHGAAHRGQPENREGSGYSYMKSKQDETRFSPQGPWNDLPTGPLKAMGQVKKKMGACEGRICYCDATAQRPFCEFHHRLPFEVGLHQLLAGRDRPAPPFPGCPGQRQGGCTGQREEASPGVCPL